MNAANEHRGFVGTTVETLLAIFAFCCLMAGPPAADAADGFATVGLHSGEHK